MGKRGQHPIAETHLFHEPHTKNGRLIFKRMIDGVLRNHVKVTCQSEGCGKRLVLLMKMVLPDQVLTKKFRQKGWDLNPDTCPDCIEKAKTS